MKKFFVLGAVVVLAGGLAIGSGMIRQTAAQIAEYFYGDPDMPFETGMSKEEYMLRRSEQIAMLRGIDKDHPFEPQLRTNAIQKMESQKDEILQRRDSGLRDAMLSGWSELGPNPIPNGQT